MPASKVKPLNKIIVGLVCLLFLASGAFSFAADTQIELQMSPFPAPSNLTATVVGSNQIDLSWSAVSGAVSYKVFRAGILITSPTTTSYSNTGLSSGTTYSYTVSAVNADGAESPQSSSVSATTQSAPGGGMPAAWFMPPKTPEGGFRILINDGAEYTDSLIVTLTLFSGPDTARMAISNFSDFRDVGQEPYTTSKTWDLCKGRTSCPEGEYTVYAKFYAPWGTASEVVSDSIIYKKPIIESIIAKINEIARKIADLKKQIAQLFKKEIVAEVPEAPPEEIVPPERPPEEIVPPEKELPEEEIISPPKEIPLEKEKVKPFTFLKAYVRWLWQKIIDFW